MLILKFVNLAPEKGDSGAPVLFQEISGTKIKSTIAGVYYGTITHDNDGASGTRLRRREIMVKLTHKGVRKWIDKYAK